MKNYLFAALLGCFVVSGLAQTRDFIFTDTQGRCWQCPIGIMCFPCLGIGPNAVVPPPQTDPSCAAPLCNNPETRHILSSHNTAYRFYQCVLQGTEWTAVEMQCPCGLMFNYASQACDWPWEWHPFCTAAVPQVIECETTTTSTTTVSTTTQLEVTTNPATTPNPCQCIPWIPCWCNPCMTGGMMGMNGCMG
jgi:hypothetical protein